jgi:hypothetical protein
MNRKMLLICFMVSLATIPTAYPASFFQGVWDRIKSCLQSKTTPEATEGTAEAPADTTALRAALEDIDFSIYDSSLRYFGLEHESALQAKNAQNIIAALQARKTAAGDETLLKETLLNHMQRFVGTISQAIHTRPATRNAAKQAGEAIRKIYKKD